MNPFLVTDEAIVNHYGFRVLTSGIDTSQFERNPLMYFMHNRNEYNPKGNEVIGLWKDLEIKDGKIFATPVFDEAEPFAKEIQGKVSRGFIKMASIGIEIIETSEDPKYMLAGQIYPTVTKCRLIEISIVDQGANDNALMLYDPTGAQVKLSIGKPIPQLTQNLIKNRNTMTEYKNLAAALNLNAEATEAEVLAGIKDNQAQLQAANDKLAAIEAAKKAAEQTEATALLTKAKDNGLIDDTGLASYQTLFESNHQAAKTVLEGMLSKVTDGKDNKTQTVNTFLSSVANDKPAANDPKKTFDYLQKHDSKELKRIKDQEPETFQELVNDYARGVRYTS